MAIKKKALVSDYLVCVLSAVPLYAKPNESSLLVSQLLFGETASIITRKSKQWARILTHFDQVEAWVDVRQLTYITESQFNTFSTNFAVALEICQVLMNNDLSFPVLIGSSLPVYDGMLFRTPNEKYIYNGQAAPFTEVSFTPDKIGKIARRFVNAPFFHGGRTIFGIDKVALIQLIYKCAGIKLSRDLLDIYKSIDQTVDFVELSNPGDVVFFVNKNDEVDHIGIIIGDQEVLHVLEKARIDRLDHEGIFNKESRKYTHKLKVIARFLD